MQHGNDKPETADRLTFGSLFAGIGGFDLGFERAGMICRWQIEIDPYCNRVLAKHWPDVRRWPDVRTWPQPDTERVDVICGGFPCQDVSRQGPMCGVTGHRTRLFDEAIRIIDELRPRVACLENVAGLLDGGIGEVLRRLAEIGYDAEWDCVPAAAVGADQIRGRVFILAYPQHCWLEERRRTYSIGSQMLYRSGVCEYVTQGGTIKTDQALAKFARYQTQWNGEPGVDRVANGVPARMDRLRGLGNAVVPQVAEWIGQRIVQRTLDTK